MRQSRMSVKKLVLSMWALVFMAVLLLAGPVHAAETAFRVQLPVSCTGGDPNETFQFDLLYENVQGQTVETGTLFLKSGESGCFVIAYDSPGTYHYTISQTAGTDSQTVYDKTVYSVDVWVTTDDDGVLSAAPIIYAEGSSDKKAELNFVNSKTSSGKDNPKPGGHTEKTSTVKTSSVQTGDTAQPGLWIAVILAAAGAMIVVLRKTRKKGEAD